MEEKMSRTTTDYRCPTHNQQLHFVLRADAGWCGQCRVYVQAADVPMSALDPHLQAKREAAQQPKHK